MRSQAHTGEAELGAIASNHDALQSGIRRYLGDVLRSIAEIDPAEVAALMEFVWRAWQADRTVFVAGNGGSAATASHIAADLTRQTRQPGRRPLRALSLADSVELITAVANDLSFARIFSEQLRIQARPGDLLLVLSCSGTSRNIVAAIEEARSIGMHVVAMGGTTGGRVRTLADAYVHVPSFEYGIVESVHVVLEHCVARMLWEYGRQPARVPAVFVDRDGVVVRNRDDYVKSLAELEFLPGAVDALARLGTNGHRVLMVTNQSALGRGLLDPDTLELIHGRIRDEVASRGGRLDGILVCPHSPEAGCDCRKPAPGLLREAELRYGIDLSRSYMIGDHDVDVQAALAAGATPILVLTGRTASAPEAAAYPVAADLGAAVELILGGRSVLPATAD